MTIKTATGIKRFQDNKGYGAWFNQLLPLVQSRDSCQPEMAVEPSSTSSNSKYNTKSDSLDLEDNDELDLGETHVKEFVPLKKKKLSAKDPPQKILCKYTQYIV